MITVDGTGCVGEKIWEKGDLSDPELFELNCKGIYNVWKDVPENATAKIEAFSDDNGYIYAIGESSRMYYPEMELTRNARHIINSKNGYFILLDELESKLEHTYTWHIHSEKYADQISENHFEILNGNGGLNIFTAFPEAQHTSVDETLVEEMMTPQRPNDLRRISLKTLKIENSIKSENTYFLNVLQPKDALDKDEQNDILVKRIKGESCIGVEITSKNGTEIFLFSNKNKIVYKDIQSESKWLSIIKNNKDEIVKTSNY